jgi:hypothetical protein
MAPLQFRLRSLFLATAAVGLGFGLFRWLGREAFAALAILTIESAAMLAILLEGKGRWALLALMCVLLLVPLTPFFLMCLFGAD